MRRILMSILVVIMLIACCSCFWGVERGGYGEGDRRGYGDRGGHGEGDRREQGDRDRGGFVDRDQSERGDRDGRR